MSLVKVRILLPVPMGQSSNRKTPSLQDGRCGCESRLGPPIRPCGLTVRTPVSQSGGEGSIPSRAANPALWRRSERGGLISRLSKVQVLPASPMPVKCCQRHTPFVPEEGRGGTGRRLQFMTCSNRWAYTERAAASPADGPWFNSRSPHHTTRG